MQDVQLLIDTESVQVYHNIFKKMQVLNDVLKDNDLSVEEAPKIDRILRTFINLCCTNEDLNTPNSKNQTIFRNLNTHTEVLKILRLPYADHCHGIFKLCYLFFKQFAMKNSINQSLLFPHVEFMLSQMGYKLNISDTIIEIFKNNSNLCSQIDSSFIQHMIKLIEHNGRKKKYLGKPFHENFD